MKWNLRMAAAQRDIWRPSELLVAFQAAGFNPSLSKVAALWSGKPVTVRLDDLDRICAALGCTVADLMQAEPVADAGADTEAQAAGGERQRPGAARPHPRPGVSRRGSLPPN